MSDIVQKFLNKVKIDAFYKQHTDSDHSFYLLNFKFKYEITYYRIVI